MARLWILFVVKPSVCCMASTENNEDSGGTISHPWKRIVRATGGVGDEGESPNKLFQENVRGNRSPL